MCSFSRRSTSCAGVRRSAAVPRHYRGRQAVRVQSRLAIVLHRGLLCWRCVAHCSCTTMAPSSLVGEYPLAEWRTENDETFCLARARHGHGDGSSVWPATGTSAHRTDVGRRIDIGSSQQRKRALRRESPIVTGLVEAGPVPARSLTCPSDSIIHGLVSFTQSGPKAWRCTPRNLSGEPGASPLRCDCRLRRPRIAHPV